jgi:hypothetical protein
MSDEVNVDSEVVGAKSELFKTWDAFRDQVSQVDLDLLKTSKGVQAAGVRMRKNLRVLRQLATALIKDSLAAAADVRKARAAARGGKGKQPGKKKAQLATQGSMLQTPERAFAL